MLLKNTNEKKIHKILHDYRRVKNMTIYRSVRIPEDLINKIQEIIDEYRKLGYRSHSEFIIDATRRRVETHRKHLK